MTPNTFSAYNKRHSVGSNRRGDVTTLRKDYHGSKIDSDNYHDIDFINLPHPESWNMKELDMLEGLGFQIGGGTHMELCVPGDLEMNKYSVAKHKKLGYELKINERKHYFRTFDKMMTKIDEFGKLDL